MFQKPVDTCDVVIERAADQGERLLHGAGVCVVCFERINCGYPLCYLYSPGWLSAIFSLQNMEIKQDCLITENPKLVKGLLSPFFLPL